MKIIKCVDEKSFLVEASFGEMEIDSSDIKYITRTLERGKFFLREKIIMDRNGKQIPMTKEVIRELKIIRSFLILENK